MKLVPTMRWFLMYALLAVGGVGTGAYWFVTRSDELLKAELLRQLSAMFPTAEFAIDRANFDLTGRIRATRVRLTFPEADFAALTVSELVLTLDRDQLAESQTVQIQKVRLIQPRVWITRDADGVWNWQQLRMNSTEGGVLPDIDLEHGALTVQLASAEAASPLTFNLTEVRLSATPSSDRSWAISCSSRIDGSEPVQIRGDAHAEGTPWSVSVNADGWLLDQKLLGKVLRVRPELREQLIAAESKLMRVAESRGVSREAASRLRILQATSDGEIDLGIQLLTNLKLQASQTEAATLPQFQAQVEIQNGRITNPILPLPLHEVRGRFYADRQQIVLKNLVGRHGETSVSCSAKWSTQEQPAVVLHARRIVLDEALAARLPGTLPNVVKSLSLRGVCDVDAQLTQTELGFVPKVDLVLTDGSILHEKFRYPIRDVSAKLNWSGELAMLEGEGQAGLAPVTFTGTIKKPGPGAEMVILLRAQQVPVDQTLLQACPKVVSDVMTSLDLRGQGDAWVRLIKPAGIGSKIVPQVKAKLTDCSVDYEKFPLRIERVSGIVEWDGEKATFENLRGRHADAEILARGSFSRVPAPGRLDLQFQMANVPFDAELLAALPASLQDAWREFQPQGQFDGQAAVAWTPGSPVDIRLPVIKVKDSRVVLKHFPYAWDNVAAELSYADHRLELKELSATHDDCRIRGKGRGDFSPDLPWRFRFNELFVDDLPLSPALRRALPDDLRTIVEILNPTGTISLEGPATFHGPNSRRNAIGIEWQTGVLFSGSSLTVGQRLDNVHGRVVVQGSWDGSAAAIQLGKLELDSLDVLGHQITQVRGPFRYEQGRMTIGSPQAVVGPVVQAQNEIPWTEQVSAKAIDGTLTLNAIVDFELETHYRSRMLMIGGNLERYAQQYLPGQRDIRGTMNGWLDLQGTGDKTEEITGSGQLEIRPAELWELPVFVQIFQVLGPQLQDRTAFKDAVFQFKVNRSRFNFTGIELNGNALRLFGRGYVRFDGIVALEFFSMLGRNRFRVPILSDAIGILSAGWVGVTVTGHISDPAVEMQAIPVLNEGMRQFLGLFEPMPMTPPGRRVIPRTTQPRPPERG